jgi:hypothetical protein
MGCRYCDECDKFRSGELGANEETDRHISVVAA